MKTAINITTSPDVALDQANLDAFIFSKFQVKNYRIKKRSIDARKKKVKINLQVELFENSSTPPLFDNSYIYKNVKDHKTVVIIGSGPAGMFAALRLIELGVKPILFERGKDVQERRRDLANINKKHLVNTESNYCFGEGGAGTYSDGKLYTRSKKRGDVQRILELLVQHGARENILYDAHPHIGTNKLPKIIAKMREVILENGGEFHFNSKLTDINIVNRKIVDIKINGEHKIKTNQVILATGHSARDIFELLHRRKVKIEAKPFAMGLRVEHQQNLIDGIQYKNTERGILPASAYALKCQAEFNKETRGVFSFCMCPGGFIVPAATAPGEVVVNGMSPSRRDSKYANSGIVMAINKEDLNLKKHGIFAGLELQKTIEKQAFEWGGKTQTAPAQLLNDFVQGKLSNHLLDTSYQPGIKSVKIDEMLPISFVKRMQFAFKHFNKIMPGYLTNEAQLLGVESRTSSPIMIPRNKETLQHTEIEGLYPCGEGAGYAGGIVSAAIDGERCAEMSAKQLN